MKVTRKQVRESVKDNISIVKAISMLYKVGNVRPANMLRKQLQDMLTEKLQSKIIISVVELIGKSGTYRMEISVVGQYDIWFYPDSERWCEK